MKLDKPHKASELAKWLNTEFIGNGDLEVTGINEIHKLDKGDITFVDYEKYYDKAKSSKATAIITNKQFDIPEDKVLIISDDPFRDYNLLAQRFCPTCKYGYAHSADSYYVSPTAQVGSHTIIMPGCFIGNHVKIGSNCMIFPNVVIYDNTEIGDNVTIHANTTIGADAFNYKMREHEGGKRYDKMHTIGKTIIHNFVEIGSGCTVDRGVSANTVIGEGTKIDNQVMVGHGVEIGKNCLIAAQCGIAGKTVLEDNVILWGQVGVSKSLRLGEGCVVLAKSGVSKDLEAGKMYFGTPAREAQNKWKELALIRKLPEMWEKLK
jgi:UDP-3-O-[3-hydroxymyristoyl] glucosamine N-acyltransferase